MARTVGSTVKQRESQFDKNLHKRRKQSAGKGDAPKILEVSTDSEPGDRADEYRKKKEDRFIERVYKFAATHNVSVTIMIAQPGSSEILIGGVGYTLGKIKTRRQLYKYRYVPPTTKGKYSINMEVSKKLLMSESIVPTKLPQPGKTKKIQETNTTDIINEVPEIMEVPEIIEVPEIMEVPDVGGHGDGPVLIEEREVREVPRVGGHGDGPVVIEEREVRGHGDVTKDNKETNEFRVKTKKAESGTDKSKNQSDVDNGVEGVVAGPSQTRELELMLVEAAMDTSCSSETIGLTKPKKAKPLSRGKKKPTYERKMPLPGSIDHKKTPNKFKPSTSKHTI